MAAVAQPTLPSAAFDFRGVCLTADRKLLFRSIDKRAEEIVELGLVEETVRVLLAPGAKPNSSVTAALGYRQVCRGRDFVTSFFLFFSFLQLMCMLKAQAYLDEFWLGKRWTSPQSHRRALQRLVSTYQVRLLVLLCIHLS